MYFVERTEAHLEAVERDANLFGHLFLELVFAIGGLEVNLRARACARTFWFRRGCAVAVAYHSRGWSLGGIAGSGEEGSERALGRRRVHSDGKNTGGERAESASSDSLCVALSASASPDPWGGAGDDNHTTHLCLRACTFVRAVVGAEGALARPDASPPIER